MELNRDGVEPPIPMMSNAIPDNDTAGGSSHGEKNGMDAKRREVSFFVGLQEVQASVQPQLAAYHAMLKKGAKHSIKCDFIG